MNAKKLLTKAFVSCLLFSVAAMAAMCIFFIKREEPVNAGELVAESGMEGMMTADRSLLAQTEQQTADCIVIPLPTECTEDKIQITGDASEGRILLTIQNVSEDFFYRHPLSGNSEYVNELQYGYADGTAWIGFSLTGFCEYEKSVTIDRLYLRFLPPKDVYPRIVVLDAGHGGSDTGTTVYQIKEKEVALEAVLRAGEKLEEAGIHVYYTRTDDSDASEEDRIRTVNESQADLLVSIHGNADPRTRVTKGMEFLLTNHASGTGLTNAELTECLKKAMEQRELSESYAEGSGRGIALLDQAELPAVMIQVGYLTNKQEALRMAEEAYLDQLAEGICDGIIQAYEEMGE